MFLGEIDGIDGGFFKPSNSLEGSLEGWDKLGV
jgi:hypothetical protein